jgi:hypothetical protein
MRPDVGYATASTLGRKVPGRDRRQDCGSSVTGFDATGLGYDPPSRPRAIARDLFRGKYCRKALRRARVRRAPEMGPNPSEVEDLKDRLRVKFCLGRAFLR